MGLGRLGTNDHRPSGREECRCVLIASSVDPCGTPARVFAGFSALTLADWFLGATDEAALRATSENGENADAAFGFETMDDDPPAGGGLGLGYFQLLHTGDREGLMSETRYKLTQIRQSFEGYGGSAVWRSKVCARSSP